MVLDQRINSKELKKDVFTSSRENHLEKNAYLIRNLIVRVLILFFSL